MAEYPLVHFTHKFSGPTGPMDNQICHISNQICCQAKIEKHKENVKDHLPCIHWMQITVADSC